MSLKEKEDVTHVIDSQSLSREEDETNTRALERRVVRKLDQRIMPFICISYLFTYLDKAMLGYAAIFDLQTDLDLQGNQYSWVSSIFYFGYLVVRLLFLPLFHL